MKKVKLSKHSADKDPNSEPTSEPHEPKPNISPTLENNLFKRINSSTQHFKLLEYYAPPSIIVNEQYEILHMSETAVRLTHLPGGALSINLLKVVRPELRLELRSALYQAAKNRVSVETYPIKVRIENYHETFKITVRPILNDEMGMQGYFLVLFESTGEKQENAGNLPKEPIKLTEPIARQLEEELINCKSLLQTTVEQFEVQTEELKASNEELQVMNEETRAAAEELETSKEELQSINEELNTVNQELKVKIEELNLANNDFKNLMNSTNVGTIFLDGSLHIKLFTPNAQKVFNLIPSDLGRLLTDITSKIDYGDLISDIALVLKNLQPVDREVQTSDGLWYLMRVALYQEAEGQINGIILTFVDVTQQKEAEKSIRFQAHLLNMVEQSVIATDLDGKVIFWNKFAENLFEWKSEEALGRNIRALKTPEIMQEQAEEIMNLVRQGKSWSGTFQVHRRNGTSFPAHVINSPIEDEKGNLIGIIGVSIDITERKQTEDALRESEQSMRLMIESATDFAIFTITMDNLVDTWNTGAERVFGYRENEIIGKSSAILFTPEDRRNNVPEKELQTALNTGRAEDERWHLRRDGSRFFASGVMTPLANNNGFVKIARDMTEKIKAEEIQRDKEMLQKLVNAQEDERRRIARDLHDQLGQQMTALRLKLQASRKLCDSHVELCEMLDDIQLLAKHIDSDVDFLAWELRPAALDDLGLIASIRRYVQEWSQHSSILADFHTFGLVDFRLNGEVETNLYRITQEAFNNIWKHAKAKHANIMLERRENSVVLIIEDDGVGFDYEDKNNRNKGIGLIGMQERAALIGGTLEIESYKNLGTTIFVRVPIHLKNGELQHG